MNPTTSLKRRLQHRYFPVNFAKSLQRLFLKNTSGRLFLIDLRRLGQIVFEELESLVCNYSRTQEVNFCKKGIS